MLGIPISIKDLEATKGVRSTMGSLAYRDTAPDIDSVVVERVKASGAVILGKTNTPEFGLQGTTENRLGEPMPQSLEHRTHARRFQRRRRRSPGIRNVSHSHCHRRRRLHPQPQQLLRVCSASSRRWDVFHGPEVWAVPLPT